MAILKSADKLRVELGLPDPQELVPPDLRDFGGDVYTQAQLVMRYMEEFSGLPFTQLEQAVTPDGVAQIPGLDGLLAWFASDRKGLIVVVPKWKIDP